MNYPETPKHNRLLGVFAAILSVACVVGGASAFMSAQDEDQANVETQPRPLISCELPSDVLAPSDANMRASTQAVPWTVFNQRFGWSVLGVSPVDAAGVPTGRALRFKIPGVGRMPHDIGVSMINARPIKAGETIQARVWIKSNDALKSVNNSPSELVTVQVRFQNNEPGFRGFFQVTTPITNQFREYTFTAIAPKDFCAEELNVALHLATGQHNIDIGPGAIIITDTKQL